MMNLKSILLIVCSVLFLNSAAQTFSKLYSQGHPTLLFGSVKAIGNSLYLTGVTTANNSFNNQKAVIAKTDLSGSVIYFKPLIDSDYNNYDIFTNTLKHCNDGALIATGYETDSLQRVFLLKTDTNGNVLLWHQYIDTSTISFQGMDVTETTDHGYLIAIDKQRRDYITCVVILKTDSAGNELWRNTYVNGPEAWPTVIKPMFNGHYMLGSWIGPANDYTPYHAQMWLFEIDSAGNRVRNWVDPDTKTLNPNGMEQTSDSGWIIARQYVAYDSLDFQAYNGSLLKLDKDFNKQWEIDTGIPATDGGLFDVKILPDGSYVCDGAFPLNLSQDSALMYGWLMRVAPDGNITWLKLYLADSVYGASNYLSSLDILPDGGIVACGRVEANDIGQQGWIIFTDSTGCLQGYCGRVTNVQEINDQQQLPFKIYPNPASNYINIETDIMSPNLTVQITDNLGRVILQQAITTTNTQIALNQLVAGIYFVSVGDATGAKEIKKVVITH